MNKRHELQKNELADWLEDKIEEIRPYFPAIGIGGLLALAVVVGVWWYSSQQSQASAAAWNQYFAAIGERNQQEALEKVIASENNNEPANWARQTLADMNLARGSAAVFTDREESKQRLEEAGRHYAAILQSTSDPMLRVRATYGLARVQESLFKPEDAKKLYEQVSKEGNKDSALAKSAEEAVKRLSDPRDIEMLNWLAKQTPKRPAPSATGRPGGVPGLPGDLDLPDRPDIGLPDFGSTPLPGDAKPSSDGLSFPAPGDAPPAGDNAPADAPSADSSGDSAPPSDSPPSDSPPSDAPPASEPPADDAGSK
jgi:predicted negative regulator of RcsB-dependent stress response